MCEGDRSVRGDGKPSCEKTREITGGISEVNNYVYLLLQSGNKKTIMLCSMLFHGDPRNFRIAIN